MRKVDLDVVGATWTSGLDVNVCCRCLVCAPTDRLCHCSFDLVPGTFRHGDARCKGCSEIVFSVAQFNASIIFVFNSILINCKALYSPYVRRGMNSGEN